MLGKFEKDKRYRFNKDLFVQYCREEGDTEEIIEMHLYSWVSNIDGEIVIPLAEDMGDVSIYSAIPEWCEEIIEKKVFDENKEYKFSKELFIEDSKQDGDSERTIQLHLDSWVREIDNKFINVIDEEVGTIGIYQVIPRWCKEVVESYLYDSHVGGLYISDEELDYDDLYCDTCNDSDEYLGVVNTISDIVELTKGTCYRGKYIEEFMANITTERDW